jgi:cell wall-associated NlpC family hydrolase
MAAFAYSRTCYKKKISTMEKKQAPVRFIIQICLAVMIVVFSSFAWSAEEEKGGSLSLYDLSQRAAEIAMQAMSIIDTQYKFGGDARGSGFDCSGLVRYVYKKAWGAELPRTSMEISEVGETIEVAELLPGDLVFYNTRKRKFSHVGIYLGDNKFVHAPSRGGKVRIEDMAGRYWQVRFNGARRIIDTQKEKMEAERLIQTFRDDARPKALARSR